jgi:hypothetical protein
MKYPSEDPDDRLDPFDVAEEFMQITYSLDAFGDCINDSMIELMEAEAGPVPFAERNIPHRI